MLRTIQKSLVMLVLLGIASLGFVPRAQADVIVLTFEGVGDGASVNNFYNGGMDSAGHSGPNFGINFSENSLGLIAGDSGGSGNFIGAVAPSPVTVVFFLSGGADTMNVAAGFDTGFSFFYSAPLTGGNSVFVYDALGGAAGGGSVLASLALPATGEGFPAHLWLPVGVSFSGIARSVDFGGVANQVAFDNITLGSATPVTTVPEPSTLLLAGLSLAAIGVAKRRIGAA
jgi:hypothetical protein